MLLFKIADTKDLENGENPDIITNIATGNNRLENLILTMVQ